MLFWFLTYFSCPYFFYFVDQAVILLTLNYNTCRLSTYLSVLLWAHIHNHLSITRFSPFVLFVTYSPSSCLILKVFLFLKNSLFTACINMCIPQLCVCLGQLWTWRGQSAPDVMENNRRGSWQAIFQLVHYHLTHTHTRSCEKTSKIKH